MDRDAVRHGCGSGRSHHGVRPAFALVRPVAGRYSHAARLGYREECAAAARHPDCRRRTYCRRRSRPRDTGQSGLARRRRGGAARGRARAHAARAEGLDRRDRALEPRTGTPGRRSHARAGRGQRRARGPRAPPPAAPPQGHLGAGGRAQARRSASASTSRSPRAPAPSTMRRISGSRNCEGWSIGCTTSCTG